MASYAIIGFGCAGYHAAQAIRETDPSGIIDVYSDHPDPPYNPMLTTYYASNRLRYEGMFPFGTLDEIRDNYKLNIFPSSPVTGLDAESRTLHLENGTARTYDRILIATGASSFTPPIPNECPEAVISMRTLDDARGFRALLEEGKISRAVVIGASMAGIKVVEALSNNGAETTLADMAPHIFPLAAYPQTAERIEKELTSQGIRLKFRAGLTAIRRDPSGCAAAECSDGSLLPADLIALCIGTRANTALAAAAGIRVGKGIVVDSSMRTSADGIYAAGDCCEGFNLQNGEHQIIGLWANAAYQGYTAGLNMAGGTGEFSGNILHNITHFMGMDFIGFGDNRTEGAHFQFENREKGLWIEGIRSGDRLAGINILGNCRISGILKNLVLDMARGGSISPLSDFQEGILKKEGLSQEFIRSLEGVGIHE